MFGLHANFYFPALYLGALYFGKKIIAKLILKGLRLPCGDIFKQQFVCSKLSQG